MSLFICRAVATKVFLDQSQSRTGMQTEAEMFEALSVELSREARRQQVARLIAPVISAWTGVLERLTRPGREAQDRKNLVEKLESMPAYMLDDIGVTCDQAGRFFHYNDYGMRVELAPAAPKTPATSPKAWIEARQPAYAV